MQRGTRGSFHPNKLTDGGQCPTRELVSGTQISDTQQVGQEEPDVKSAARFGQPVGSADIADRSESTRPPRTVPPITLPPCSSVRSCYWRRGSPEVWPALGPYSSDKCATRERAPPSAGCAIRRRRG